MEGYLGEKVVPVSQSPFEGYTVGDWTMYFIEKNGRNGAPHHMAWLIDQIAQLHKGVQPVIRLAEWENDQGYHQEWRVSLGEETDEYRQWVKEMKAGEDGANTYAYDQGIAP